ncbi:MULTISPECIES: NADPH-dependent F420 reductase [Actinotignum]|uniref:NAD(P)-binding domain-containing protein n=1 Tax=Actinotignum timonense TaxID=1870995 RepID=A0AAW9HDX3_9ACTO|nr:MULTISPECIES: NAD(P)-binding domain-containing protein [Actinotignum]MBS5748199.1 NAD(P)-binding domain-containing protein [Actinotignum schaalii]MDE1558974.1 NAD(P)-binding domain-containing protein [Actinotignum schaalii]MDE1663968.1 NAD(P)-binding domain-containing protein [Actinotignum schaalii]MDK6373318.1 NAD(P)-binding domain-containing protein [Actinotignum timonense]MDK6419814.1 NAD(P)-binding domain-containing protein [Actinotignum timonense]
MNTTAQNDRDLIGLLGAGKLGTAIGRLAAEAGFPLAVSVRPGNPLYDLTLPTLLPTARLVSFEELARTADILILALPQPALASIDLSGVRGIVVDATNAWAATDGTHADNLSASGTSATSTAPDHAAANTSTTPTQNTTAALQARYPELAIVKSLNHAGYTELSAEARPHGAPGRRTVAVAGDDAAARSRVAAFIDAIGFDPVELSSEHAPLLEPGGVAFGQRLELADWPANIVATRR